MCKELGVELAPRDDKEKSFGPSTEGVVLGIYYNSVEWVWWLGEEKLSSILNMLHRVNTNQVCDVGFFKSLSGKIMNICPLVIGGKFHICQLLKAAHFSEDQSVKVDISEWLQMDCQWWATILPAFGGKNRIPDPE